jgi:PEGA domain
MPPPPSGKGPSSGGSAPVDWKRALWIGAVAGMILAVLGLALLINIARKRNQKTEAASAAVAVQVATNPPGATVRINGENKCTSNCEVSLTPGDYQIIAMLDGYEAASSGLTVAPGKPASLNLTLSPQAQAVRVVTDFDQGKVVLDDQPAVDLQEGQYIFDAVPPGQHSVKVTSRNGDASFEFQLTDAQMPSITKTTAGRNVMAVMVASFAGHAHMVTSGGPWKLTVNGQPESDAAPTGIDLAGFQPGAVNEFVVKNGNDEYTVKESFGPAPTLTARILRTDLNLGRLIVSTGNENDVRVFIDNREYPQRTRRGTLSIATLGVKTVRVSKDGFEDPPPQKVEVKKSQDARLEFTLKAKPQFAALEIVGATPGAQVRIDQMDIGAVGPDGTFHSSSIVPGTHAIEFSRQQYEPKKLERTFRAGQTVTISGSEAVLTAEHVAPPPPPPPPPKVVQPAPKAAPPPPPKPLSMESFVEPGMWHAENGVYRHRGTAFLAFKPAGSGVYVFNAYLIHGGSIFGKGRLRWRLNYVDEKNYVQFELDEDNLYSKVVTDGKGNDRDKVKHGVESKEKIWAIQIDVSPDKIVHKIQKGKQWVTLDTLTIPGRNLAAGQFGFYVQGGGDEMGVSDFSFTPVQ